MTTLRQRMLEAMRLRGLSARTQDAYARSVRQLAEHYGRSPDLISEEEFRRYFLHLVEVKRFARASLTIALCGVKFFFEHTGQRDWTVCDIVRPPRQRQLPVVLSRDEVRAILHCVRIDLYRVCLTTIYACGLRLREGTELPIHQMDSALMQLHIVGKAIGRFLQHVLPRSFVKIRSYGLYSSGCRPALELARQAIPRFTRDANSDTASGAAVDGSSDEPDSVALRTCPRCRLGRLHVVADLLPTRTRAPPCIRAPP